MLRLSHGVRRASLYEGRLKYLLNNEWKESAATEYIPVHNPATQVFIIKNLSLLKPFPKGSRLRSSKNAPFGDERRG